MNERKLCESQLMNSLAKQTSLISPKEKVKSKDKVFHLMPRLSEKGKQSSVFVCSN